MRKHPDRDRLTEVCLQSPGHRSVGDQQHSQKRWQGCKAERLAGRGRLSENQRRASRNIGFRHAILFFLLGAFYLLSLARSQVCWRNIEEDAHPCAALELSCP